MWWMKAMGPLQGNPNYGPWSNSITYYFAPAIKAMSGAADHSDHCYKTTGNVNADAVVPKGRRGAKKQKIEQLQDTEETGLASVSSGSSSVNASQSSSGTTSANPKEAAAAGEATKTPTLPLTVSKVSDSRSSLRPIRPHKWRVVNEGSFWSNGKREHFIEVKVRPDDLWARLSLVAISSVPIHLVDIYNRKFEIRNSRFIVRTLVPTSIEGGKTKGTLEWVATSWNVQTFRCHHSFREMYSEIMILDGGSYEGMVGFDDDGGVEYALKKVIDEVMAADNDAMMRLCIKQGVSGLSADEPPPPKMFPSNMRRFFCPKMHDILIDHLVHPTYDALVRTSPGKIEGYDLIEDFQNIWSRCEDLDVHSERWNLSGGEVLCREVDEDEFNPGDESMMKDISSDMHEIMIVAHNPPQGLSAEEQHKKSEIQISGPLLESFKRTVLRLTKFESLKAEIYRKLGRDHNYLVLGIPLVPDDWVHDAVIPRGFPPMTPFNDPNAWHHNRTGEIVQGPPRNITAYATVNLQAGTIDGGDRYRFGGVPSSAVPYSNAETLLVTASPPPRHQPVEDEARRGRWLIGGPGNTDPQMYDGTSYVPDQNAGTMIMGGNSTFRVYNTLQHDYSGSNSDALMMARHHQAQAQASTLLLGRLGVNNSDTDMTDGDNGGNTTDGETTAGGGMTDNEVI